LSFVRIRRNARSPRTEYCSPALPIVQKIGRLPRHKSSRKWTSTPSSRGSRPSSSSTSLPIRRAGLTARKRLSGRPGTARQRHRRLHDLNVQHLESRADTVAQITGSIVRETVPDSIFESADWVAIVDVPPDASSSNGWLTARSIRRSGRAEAGPAFFRRGTSRRQRNGAAPGRRAGGTPAARPHARAADTRPWKSGQRTDRGDQLQPNSGQPVRWARRTRTPWMPSWVAVHVETARPPGDQARDRLAMNIKLAQELGAEIISHGGRGHRRRNPSASPASRTAPRSCVGKPERRVRLRAGMLDRLIERSGDLDIYVVGGDEAPPERAARPASRRSGAGSASISSQRSSCPWSRLALYPFAMPWDNHDFDGPAPDPGFSLSSSAKLECMAPHAAAPVSHVSAVGPGTYLLFMTRHSLSRSPLGTAAET